MRPATFREALRRAGLLGREDVLVLYWHETKGAPLASVVRAATDKCIQIGAKLLIVDTINQFARFRDEDENHSGPVLEAMEPLQEAAGRGLAVVMGRHARKTGGQVGDSGRGSSAFPGAADIVLSIRRPEGQGRDTVREIHALARFEETPSLLVIELASTGYIVLGGRADVIAQDIRAALVNVLLGLGNDALSLDELMTRLPQELKAKRTTVQTILKELQDSGDAKLMGAGVKGDPFRYGHSFCQNLSAESASPNDSSSSREN